MKNFLTNTRPLNTDAAIFLLRLLFGGLFIWHGYEKIASYDLYVNMFPDLIGIGGKLSYQLVIAAEFVGGMLIVLGLFTRIAVLPILFSMCIAYFMAHKADPFDKKEVVLIFMWLSVVLFILGSGQYSLDAVIYQRKKKSHG